MSRHRKDGNYLRDEDWQNIHGKRFNCKCNKCGKEGQKIEMPGIYVRKNGNDSHRILCRLCFDCLPVLLAELGVKMPE